MRRYAWVVAGLVLLALWAWQQRTPDAVAPTPGPAVSPSTSPSSTSTTSASAPAAPSATRPNAPTRLPRTQRDDARYPAWLPREAFATLQRIESGGPFAHRQDGGVFQNRESRLPARARGYYREYTVETAGSRDRGARRIIAGGNPPVEYFYTDDHYGSFRRFDAAPAGSRR